MEEVEVILGCTGTWGVGKTSLLMTYATSKFKELYPGTHYDYRRLDKIFDGKHISFYARDTPGEEDYYRIREFLYCDTNIDVFLLCFDLTRPHSYERILNLLWPEINRLCPNTPLILVGMKADLLEDERTLIRLREEGDAPLSHEDGLRLSKEINAVKYMECSSLTQEGLEEVFQEAYNASLKKLPTHYPIVNKNHHCTLL